MLKSWNKQKMIKIHPRKSCTRSFTWRQSSVRCTHNRHIQRRGNDPVSASFFFENRIFHLAFQCSCQGTAKNMFIFFFSFHLNVFFSIAKQIYLKFTKIYNFLTVSKSHGGRLDCTMSSFLFFFSQKGRKRKCFWLMCYGSKGSKRTKNKVNWVENWIGIVLKKIQRMFSNCILSSFKWIKRHSTNCPTSNCSAFTSIT